MGPRRFERPTSSLSGTRSNQLSYEPARAGRISPSADVGGKLYGREALCQRSGGLEARIAFDSILCEPNE